MGVLRDDKGAWVVGFSENLGHCSSVKEEIRVVLRGLKVARDAKAQKVWLRSEGGIGYAGKSSRLAPGA